MVDNYQAYLLRLKRTQSNGHWRATLQNIQTGETMHFATEEDMVRHLLKTLTDAPINVQSSVSLNELSM